MSTIVVVVKNGEIVIGADTLSVQGGQATSNAHFGTNKIVSVGENFIGIAGASSAKLAVLDYFTKHQERLHFLGVTEVFSTVLSLHRSLVSDYFLVQDNDNDASYESSNMDMIICNRSGAYVVTAHRSVDKVLRYHAIGTGEMYALGAAHSLFSQTELTATQIVSRSIMAAAEFDVGTGLPTTIYTIQLDIGEIK